MTLKRNFKTLVEDEKSKQGRYFNLFIQVLIVFSLISISVETLPDLNPEIRKYLEILEIVSVLIFTIEYLLRIFVAGNKRGYIFSFYGIIDLVAILPFYISTGLDLRSIRVFRLLRLLRLLKIARFNDAMNRFSAVLRSIRAELILFVLITLCVLYIAALGIYYFENPAQPDKFSSVFHSLWWAIATLTTLGYGDVYPITSGGRAFTFVILMIGIGLISVPTGLIASALTRIIKKENNEQDEE